MGVKFQFLIGHRKRGSAGRQGSGEWWVLAGMCVEGFGGGGCGGGEGQASFPKGTNLVSGRSNSERPGASARIFNPASGKPAAGEGRPWAQRLKPKNCVCAKIWLCTCVWVH